MHQEAQRCYPQRVVCAIKADQALSITELLKHGRPSWHAKVYNSSVGLEADAVDAPGALLISVDGSP